MVFKKNTFLYRALLHICKALASNVALIVISIIFGIALVLSIIEYAIFKSLPKEVKNIVTSEPAKPDKDISKDLESLNKLSSDFKLQCDQIKKDNISTDKISDLSSEIEKYTQTTDRYRKQDGLSYNNYDQYSKNINSFANLVSNCTNQLNTVFNEFSGNSLQYGQYQSAYGNLQRNYGELQRLYGEVSLQYAEKQRDCKLNRSC